MNRRRCVVGRRANAAVEDGLPRRAAIGAVGNVCVLTSSNSTHSFIITLDMFQLSAAFTQPGRNIGPPCEFAVVDDCKMARPDVDMLGFEARCAALFPGFWLSPAPGLANSMIFNLDPLKREIQALGTL